MFNKILFRSSVVIGYVLLTIVAITLSFFPIEFLWMDWDLGLILGMLIPIHFASSWKSVDASDWGIRMIGGYPIDSFTSGPVFIPLFFCTLETLPRGRNELEIPSDPENIYRAPKDDTTGVVPPGKKPPVRITFGPPQKADGIDADNPLHVQMTQEVDVAIWYRVEDAVKFRIAIKTIQEAEKQLEDFVVATLSEAFAKVTPAVAFKNLAQHSENLKNAIDAHIHDWGVYVEAVKVKGINIDRALNTAMIEVPRAKETARAAVIAGKAGKTTTKLAGEGKGLAEKAVLDGRTAGLKKMMEDLGISGDAVLAAETARGITENPGQKTIIAGSQGFSDLAKVGAILGEAFKEGTK